MSLSHCDRRGDSRDYSDDDDDLRRRSSQDSVLRSVDGSSSYDYYTRLNKRDFDGPSCDQSGDCERLCEQIFSSRSRSDCESLPEDMVEVLYENYKILESIRDIDSVDPAVFAEIINMDSSVIIDLIRSRWEVRDIEAFLIWTAKNPVVIQVLEDEDDQFEIFKRIFTKLSEKRFSSRNIMAGLTADLDRYTQTFLYKAYESKNEDAFEYVFDFLDESCSGSQKTCKLLLLCSREKVESRRILSDSPLCPYFSGNRYIRHEHCYIQGPSIWSYVNSLIEDNDLSDRDIESVPSLDEEFCDDFCDQNDCERTRL